MFSLITTKEAARLTGIRAGTLQQWRIRCHPDRPQPVKVGRDLFYRPLDLVLYLLQTHMKGHTK